MENVRDISLSAIELITDELKRFNIKLSEEKEDEIYNVMFNVLEGVSNGDYKYYN